MRWKSHVGCGPAEIFEEIGRDEEQALPESQFYGVMLSYDNITYEASYRLGNGNVIALTEHYKCCSNVGDPANVQALDNTSYYWRSCNYTYTGYTGGVITATVSSATSNTVTIDTTEYDMSPFGVIVYDITTYEYLEVSDAVGEFASIYFDSEGNVGLITISTDI